jgi:hypothetical protein
MGLALLVITIATADELLRKEIHREFRDRSYMLVEYADGATLYQLDETNSDESSPTIERVQPVAAALAKTQSVDARIRARGLAELAGIDGFEVLSAGLSLLADPDPAVRDEAKYLILDHPGGTALAASLGLVDDELGE